MKSSIFGPATAEGLSNSQVQPSVSGNEFLDYVRERRKDPVIGPINVGGGVFLTADDKMRQLFEIIEQIADANVPVLITGESGTGKEVIARMIHSMSRQPDRPFVAINCAAVPPSLLESEMFGYEKGAFTGAHARHIGRFEQASGGTLLLDEVTEIEPSTQAKLLRALQEREIERIGGSGPISVNARIIATSNRDIATAVRSGEFRQDLYYRLYVINLEVPALRMRPADIELLADYFLKQFAQQFGRKPMTLASDAKAKLLKYPWPGNVRELQNVLQRAVLICKSDTVTATDIPVSNAQVSLSTEWVKHLPLGRTMTEVERNFIIETLKHHNGNRTHAAKTLGISLRTLRNKINEFTAGGHEVPAPTSGKAL